MAGGRKFGRQMATGLVWFRGSLPHRPPHNTRDVLCERHGESVKVLLEAGPVGVLHAQVPREV